MNIPREVRRPALIVTSVLLGTVLLAAGCSSGPPSGSAGGQTTITLYSGQHQQTTATLVAAFEKKTGINVKVRNNDEAVLANQIVTEGSASPADVIYTENSPALEQLQGKNLLTPVAPSTLATVPSRYSSPTGDWVGVSARVSMIVYNTDRLSPGQLPRSILDLADPRWKGKIGLAQGETDFLPLVISVERTYGKSAAAKWLAAVKSNAGANVYPDNEVLTNEVNAGHIELGIINSYYWHRQRAEVGRSAMHSALATFAPGDAGYVIDVSGAGVLASSTEKMASQRFVAFLVGAEGQEIIAHSQSYEYPLGSGVTTAQPLPPFATLQPAPLTIPELGDGSSAISLLQQAQLA